MEKTMSQSVWIMLFIMGATILGTVLGIMYGADTSQLDLGLGGGVGSINAVMIQDSQHNSGIVTSGHVLSMQWIGSGNGAVRWEYYVRETDTWATIIQSTNDNPINWKVPGTIFGTVTFRVSSVNNLTVNASAANMVIAPTVTWEGAGNFEENLVFRGQTAVFKYSEQGTWIMENGVELLVARSTSLFKTFIAIPKSAVTVDVDKKTLTWAVSDKVEPGIYKIRFATTNQIAAGRPFELTYDMQRIITVSDQMSFSMSGHMCDITVKSQMSTGRQTVFSPSESITLQIANWTGPLPVHDLYYSTDGTQWTTIAKTQSTDTYGWTMPANVWGTIRVRVVRSGISVTTTASANYAEIQVSVGVYMTMQGDASSKKPVIDYRGVRNPIVSSMSLYVVGSTDTTSMSNLANWTVGWYVSPNRSHPIDRIHSCRVVGVTTATGSPLPNNTSIVSVEYVDNGYMVGAKTVPLFAELRLPSKATGTQNAVNFWSQALYTLKP